MTWPQKVPMRYLQVFSLVDGQLLVVLAVPRVDDEGHGGVAIEQLIPEVVLDHVVARADRTPEADFKKGKLIRHEAPRRPHGQRPRAF